MGDTSRGLEKEMWISSLQVQLQKDEGHSTRQSWMEVCGLLHWDLEKSPIQQYGDGFTSFVSCVQYTDRRSALERQVITSLCDMHDEFYRHRHYVQLSSVQFSSETGYCQAYVIRSWASLGI